MDDASRVVHHEKPGYAYRPQGLMAEPWGTTGHRTEVDERIRQGQLQRRSWMDNDSGRDAVEYVWSLDDATTLAGQRYGSPEHGEICRRLEPVNPRWVTAQCAVSAYERGLIDEAELDRIMNE